MTAQAKNAPAAADADVDAKADVPKVDAPKPGSPDYDWSADYGTSDLYLHTYPDGQVVALRRFKDIYSKQWLRSIRGLTVDFDIESAAVDRGTCQKARDLIDSRPSPIGGPDDFDDLWNAWIVSDGDDSKGADGLTSGE